MIAGFLQRLACGNIELVVFWLHFLQLQKSIVRLRVTPWVRVHTIDKQTPKHRHTDTATQKHRLPGISPHASVDEHIARTVKDRSRTHTHTCARVLVRAGVRVHVQMDMCVGVRKHGFFFVRYPDVFAHSGIPRSAAISGTSLEILQSLVADLFEVGRHSAFLLGASCPR